MTSTIKVKKVIIPWEIVSCKGRAVGRINNKCVKKMYKFKGNENNKIIKK